MAGRWNLLLVALEPRAYEWCRAAMTVGRLIDEGAPTVVVVRAGSAIVHGDVGVLASEATTLVPRVVGPLPTDGLEPDERALLERGRFSTAMAGFGPGGVEALRWLATQFAGGAPLDVFERAAELFGTTQCVDDSVVVAGWRGEDVDAPVLIDADDVNACEPWRLAFDREPRVRLSEHSALAIAITRGADQLRGHDHPLTLPGGIVVDAAMRSLVLGALSSGDLPPEPFGPCQSGFVRWLETPSPPWSAQHGRYWRQLHMNRTDLQVAFPKAEGIDSARFAEWIDASWTFAGGSALLHRSNGIVVEPLVDAGREPAGVNVVGYHTHDLSLGLIAREIVAALDAARVPNVAIDHHRTGSPPVSRPPLTTRELRFATNLAVVNADQFEFLVADHGATLLPGRHTIGYWFWELESVPGHMVAAIDHVDEIWVGSRFVGDAFAAVTDKPVHVVPIPVREPQPSAMTRSDIGMADDRFVFLVTFDHFSVTERKNPFGAIEAFRRAFPSVDPGGPLLFVKTVNGDIRWSGHERVRLSAAGRSDIVVRDEHSSRADQMAYHRLSDCLVSLHRSEGLGLHCAEAMWLGKPVIATRYSGNLDFMDDSCAALVDAGLVPVQHGEGVYPPSARWADPDLDQAADWMRRISDDSVLAARLGDAARARMQAQPSLAQTGALIAELVSARRRGGSPDR